jgi:hypothetical protein
MRDVPVLHAFSFLLSSLSFCLPTVHSYSSSCSPRSSLKGLSCENFRAILA